MPKREENLTGFLIKGFILLVLRGYKKYISPFLPPACRYEPTCSVYVYQAIQKKGILKGLYWGLKRVLRCHPFCAGGFDPVPQKYPECIRFPDTD